MRHADKALAWRAANTRDRAMRISELGIFFLQLNKFRQHNVEFLIAHEWRGVRVIGLVGAIQQRG